MVVSLAMGGRNASGSGALEEKSEARDSTKKKKIIGPEGSPRKKAIGKQPVKRVANKNGPGLEKEA